MTKLDLQQEINRSRLKYEILDKKLDMILENQQIIMQQGLFILDYLIGDDEKREEIKKNLGNIFDKPVNNKPVNKKRRAI